jgi:hypothetical protein
MRSGLTRRRARIVQHVRRLQANEPTVRARERKRLRPPIHRTARNDMLERDPLIPSVPLLLPAERTPPPSIAAAQKIEDALHHLTPQEIKGAPHSPVSIAFAADVVHPSKCHVPNLHMASILTTDRRLAYRASGKREQKAKSEHVVERQCSDSGSSCRDRARQPSSQSRAAGSGRESTTSQEPRSSPVSGLAGSAGSLSAVAVIGIGVDCLGEHASEEVVKLAQWLAARPVAGTRTQSRRRSTRTRPEPNDPSDRRSPVDRTAPLAAAAPTEAGQSAGVARSTPDHFVADCAAQVGHPAEREPVPVWRPPGISDVAAPWNHQRTAEAPSHALA